MVTKKLRQLADDLLHKELDEFSRPLRFLVNQFRLAVYIWKELVRDNCLGRACALAYTTLLAIIPVMTISFSTYKAFGGLEQFEGSVRQAVFNWFLGARKHVAVQTAPPHAESQSRDEAKEILENYAASIADWINKLSERLSSAMVNIVALIFLIVTSIFLLNTIEGAFNNIWNVAKRRGLIQKVTVFWAVITLGPVLIGASVFLTNQVRDWVEKLPHLNLVSRFVFRMLPIFVTCLAFFLLYVLVPNAKVRWRAALAGALVGGILWEFAKMGFNLYITKVVLLYSKTYGSLGLIPIFLVFVFLFWLIVLFGAEVTYTIQNLHALRYEERRAKRGAAPQDGLAVRMVLAIMKEFAEGKEPLSIPVLSRKMGHTEDELRPVAERLLGAGILATVNGPDTLYLPAKPADRVTVTDVITAVKPPSSLAFSSSTEQAERTLSGIFDEIDEATRKIASRMNFADLIDRDKGEGS